MTETNYTPETFEEFSIDLDPEAPPVEVSRDEVPRTLPERFENLLRHDPRFRALWERDRAARFPSGKQSDSEYAASLMWRSGANGFTDAECAAILRAFYARPGMKPLHPQKEALTLRSARKGREEKRGEPGPEETTPDTGVDESTPRLSRSADEFLSGEIRPVEWAVEDIWPVGDSGLIGGPEKTGKRGWHTRWP